MESSIIIPAYNSQNTIAGLIKACLNQSVKTEIIVVDDGSTDNTAGMAKRYPVKYVFQENAGPAAARNTGWKAASGEFIFFTDSDCIPGPDWIKEGLSKYDSPQVGGVGGSYDIANPDSLLARCIHQEIIQRHSHISGGTNFLGSFNVSYRRKVLEEVRGFDDSFLWASAEDNDLSYRILKKGYKLVFAPEIKVLHFHTQDLLEYLREQERHGYWRIKLYRLHPDMMQGDEYSGWLDFIQPVIATLTPLSALLYLFRPYFALLPLLLAFFMLTLQFFFAWKVVRRTSDRRYFFLVPVMFLRSFARALGMICGIFRFYLSPKEKTKKG